MTGGTRMDKLRVGVVGLRFGRTWMNGFRYHPRCRLACVCDIDVAALERGAAESRPDIVTSRFEDVVDDGRIDVHGIALI